MINSITDTRTTNRGHTKMKMNHKHDRNCRFALRKGGMGSVEATLLVIAGFIACAWGLNDVKNGSGEVATDVRLRQVAAEMVKVSEAAKIGGIDLVDDHSVQATISNIEKGATATYSVFAGSYYGVAKVDPVMRTKLGDFLYVDGGKLHLAK